MIEVKDLTKSFEDKTVLFDINTTFETGKTNLVIGQSGSGKTVLMKNLIGLLKPTSGQILYDGRNFVEMSKKEMSMMRRKSGHGCVQVGRGGVVTIIADRARAANRHPPRIRRCNP